MKIRARGKIEKPNGKCALLTARTRYENRIPHFFAGFNPLAKIGGKKLPPAARAGGQTEEARQRLTRRQRKAPPAARAGRQTEEARQRQTRRQKKSAARNRDGTAAEKKRRAQQRRHGSKEKRRPQQRRHGSRERAPPATETHTAAEKERRPRKRAAQAVIGILTELPRLRSE